jgi:hypothetical protein
MGNHINERRDHSDNSDMELSDEEISKKEYEEQFKNTFKS